MKYILTLVFIVALLPSSAEAQQRVRCESDGNNYNLCRIGIQRGDEVRLSQRYSKASCQQGRTWGLERGGIWVDKGCRAEFLVTRHTRADSSNSIYYGGDSYGDRYGDRRRDFDQSYDRRGYDRRNRRRIQGSRFEDDNRSERRRLAEERRKLEAERREFENRRKNIRSRGSCPAGARVGKCSKKERARGCKDWKAADRTPCKSGG